MWIRPSVENFVFPPTAEAEGSAFYPEEFVFFHFSVGIAGVGVPTLLFCGSILTVNSQSSKQSCVFVRHWTWRQDFAKNLSQHGLLGKG